MGIIFLGGSFRGHLGNWHRDSSVEAMKAHPILRGVAEIWAPSNVYRTCKEGGGLPEGCKALVYGQPLIGREYGGKANPNKEPLPVSWLVLADHPRKVGPCLSVDDGQRYHPVLSPRFR